MLKPFILVATLLVLISPGFGGDPITVQGAMLDERVVYTANGFLADPCGLESVYCDYEETIEEKIKRKAIDAGVNPDVALRIATCESSLIPTARNAHSTATGLYQFTKGTWSFIGAEKEGRNRENVDDSIAMFMKWYPKYPGWWECS